MDATSDFVAKNIFWATGFGQLAVGMFFLQAGLDVPIACKCSPVGPAKKSSFQARFLAILSATINYLAAIGTLLNAGDYGFLNVGSRRVNVARYVVYLLATPLIILQLAFLLSLERLLTIFIMGNTAMMVFTGLVGLLIDTADGWLWFGVGMFHYVITFGVLWNRVRSVKDASRTFNFGCKMTLYTAITWVYYPILWVLERAGMIDLSSDAVLNLIATVLCKVVFGVLLFIFQLSLRTVESHEPSSKPLTGLSPAWGRTPREEALDHSVRDLSDLSSDTEGASEVPPQHIHSLASLNSIRGSSAMSMPDYLQGASLGGPDMYDVAAMVESVYPSKLKQQKSQSVHSCPSQRGSRSAMSLNGSLYSTLN